MPGTPLLMTFPVTATSHLLPEYLARGGYGALEKALTTMQPVDVTKEVTASGLLGHGGAAFPVGRKWAVIKPSDGQPHFLCANADEGEPGTFKDRWILENNPHQLIESMLLAGYALGVRNAFVYMRGEFDLPYRRLQAAIEEAYAAGYLGKPLHGTEYLMDLVIIRGAGSYVCGEASGLLTSIEGKKGYPRNRPPRLTVKGLYQRPTVVNNVETLANVAVIIRMGAEAFRKVGTAKSPGTQLVSISGHAVKPGEYEVEHGYPLKKFLFEDCGGMIAIAEGTCMVRLLQVMLRFWHHESCGQCTPCREGMGWMHRIIDRIVSGQGRMEDIDQLIAISDANDGTTICGMGDAAGYATVGFIAKFRDEFEYFIQHKRSKYGGALEVDAAEVAHA